MPLIAATSEPHPAKSTCDVSGLGWVMESSFMNDLNSFFHGNGQHP